MKPRDLTPSESDAYDERVAICVAEGIAEARAHEIARQQVRPTPPKQMRIMDVLGITPDMPRWLWGDYTEERRERVDRTTLEELQRQCEEGGPYHIRNVTPAAKP